MGGTMTPISPRALKVEGGRVVHVVTTDKEGVPSGHRATGGSGSLVAPDGTYLRLDYVVDVLRGFEAQAQPVPEPRKAAKPAPVPYPDEPVPAPVVSLRDIIQFFEARPL